MSETEEKVKLDYKSLTKVALKTLGAVFIGIMFVICSIFFLAPRLSLKISGIIGSVRAEEVCYKRIYEKSGSIADLYNLIVFNSNQKDYDEELAYINEITQREDYAEFCSSLDKASVKKISSKSLIPYSCDTNAFIRSQKVVCMYNMNEVDEIYLLVQTTAGELSDLSIAVYIDLINDDVNLTNSQKIDKLNSLKNKGITINQSYTNTNDIILNRINALNVEIERNIDETREIVLQYSLTRMYRAEYVYYTILGDTTKAESYKTLYNNSNSILNALYGV